MTGTPLIAVLAVLALLVGLWLMWAGTGLRRRRGLSGGQTVSLDKLTLRSHRLGLTGRPDRLIKADGTLIPEEWKSSRQLRAWHRAQMGVYFALIEDQLGMRPPHGFVVTGDGTAHRVENTVELRAWVLGMADRIRAAREAMSEPIIVHPKPGQCPPCGMRGHCRQARL
jgi:CRISPR/Cas system-associated exonuclease Cas4 (RecB family)